MLSHRNSLDRYRVKAAISIFRMQLAANLHQVRCSTLGRKELHQASPIRSTGER